MRATAKDRFRKIKKDLVARENISEGDLKNRPVLFIKDAAERVFNLNPVRTSQFIQTMDELGGAPEPGAWKGDSYYNSKDGTYSIAFRLDYLARIAAGGPNIDLKISMNDIGFVAKKYKGKMHTLIYDVGEAQRLSFLKKFKKERYRGDPDTAIMSKIFAGSSTTDKWPRLFLKGITHDGNLALNVSLILGTSKQKWKDYADVMAEVTKFANNKSNTFDLVVYHLRVAEKEVRRLDSIMTALSKNNSGKGLNNLGLLEDINFLNGHVRTMALALGEDRSGKPGAPGGGGNTQGAGEKTEPDPNAVDLTNQDQEKKKVTQCSDGLDNDGDGKIDVADTDCVTAADEFEGPEADTPTTDVKPDKPADPGASGSQQGGSQGGKQEIKKIPDPNQPAKVPQN